MSYKRIKLDECVQKVNVDYEKNWDNACKIAGKKPNCTLSVFQSQTVEEIRKHSLNMCVEIFKYNN